MARMTPLQRAQRIKVVIERDGPLCVWCSTRLSARHRDATLDHALPYALDGSNRPLNLLLSCGSCNWRRGTMELDHFAKKMEKSGFRVQRALVEDAEDRLKREPLVLRSACASASGLDQATVKTTGQVAKPAIKARRRTKKLPCQAARKQAPAALGRLGIDFAEELAWAYAA